MLTVALASLLTARRLRRFDIPSRLRMVEQAERREVGVGDPGEVR